MTHETNIVDFAPHLEQHKAEKLLPLSLEEAMKYLQEEKSTNIIKIQALYELVSVHVREDFLAKVAKSKDNEVSPLRKSMLFQVAHYSINVLQGKDISMYMALAIYYGLQQEKTTVEISRLGDIFIRNGLPENAILESFIINGLSGAPWKFTGNERTKIITSLRTFYRSNPQ